MEFEAAQKSEAAQMNGEFLTQWLQSRVITED